jgi:hypothetical protein
VQLQTIAIPVRSMPSDSRMSALSSMLYGRHTTFACCSAARDA